jgi:hypothetical protein
VHSWILSPNLRLLCHYQFPPRLSAPLCNSSTIILVAKPIYIPSHLSFLQIPQYFSPSLLSEEAVESWYIAREVYTCLLKKKSWRGKHLSPLSRSVIFLIITMFHDLWHTSTYLFCSRSSPRWAPSCHFVVLNKIVDNLAQKFLAKAYQPDVLRHSYQMISRDLDSG